MEKDELFIRLQSYAMQLMRKEKRKENGFFEFPEAKKGLLIGYGLKHYMEWTNKYNNKPILVVRRIIEFKVLSIKEWVKTDYKTKEYIMKENAKYYKGKTKIKNNHIDQKEHLAKNAKTKTDASYKKTKEAYEKCIEAQIKPSVAKCVTLCGLSKNTVNKYLRQIKCETK